MENTQKKKHDLNEEKMFAGSQPANKDHEQIEKETDDALKSQKEELEKRKKRIHDGSSKPDREHIGG